MPLRVFWGKAFALRFLAAEILKTGRRVRAVWGQCGGDLFPSPDAVEVPGVEMTYATEDGSCGFCGTSVECAGALIESELVDDGPRLYGSGPLGMLRAMAALARERGLSCQVSLEARMACGVGLCRGCVVNAVRPHPGTGLIRRAVCSDGPVFDAAEIDWERPW
jgi:dihydroorotate dehydrogenase electron transfer subunit